MMPCDVTYLLRFHDLEHMPMRVYTCLCPARTQNAFKLFSLRSFSIHLLFPHPLEAGIHFIGENRHTLRPRAS